MKKILSVFFLSSFLAAGMAITTQDVASKGPSAGRCDSCPPGWKCHVKPSGQVICICPKGCGWADGF